MGAHQLSTAQIRQFDEDGYLILHDYFPHEDMGLLRSCFKTQCMDRFATSA